MSYRIRRMFRTVKKLLTVALATALEGLQQPVCLLLALTSIELTVLQPLVQINTFGEGGRLSRDSGLAFMLVFGILIAAFTSGSTLAREIGRGTVATALSKPISRTVFLLGKFLGAVMVLAVFCWASTFAILFAERCSEHYIETKSQIGHIRDTACGILAVLAPLLALAKAGFVNWRWRFRFGLWFFIFLSVIQPLLFLFLGLLRRDGVFSGLANYDFAMDFRIIPAAILIALVLAVFAALATALSTRLQTGAAVAVSAAVLFVGFLADSQFGGSSNVASRLLYSAIPDVQHFWVVDSLADGGLIPKTYVMHAGFYAATYMSFVLFLGALSFKHRDLG